MCFVSGPAVVKSEKNMEEGDWPIEAGRKDLERRKV
jgi:hypothetical protein